MLGVPYKSSCVRDGFFCADKTPIEVIKEGAFGGTNFGDIYFSVNGRWYRKSQEVFNESKMLIVSLFARITIMLV